MKNSTELLEATVDYRTRESFLELHARERAKALLDADSFRELLGPFDRVTSPWLAIQDIVPEADDGCIVAKGTIDGHAAVVVAIEGKFQGGSIGEVCGMKLATALELARKDTENGTPTYAVLLLETGGVRLQEANLGLALISEIHAQIMELRQHVPVVGVVAGMVGCFGGMSLAAALCTSLIVTRQARLGMNGPEVIEQEAGIEEFNASDRALVWSVDGGEYRVKAGFADLLVPDDARAVAKAVRHELAKGVPAVHRSSKVEHYRNLLAQMDTSRQWDAAMVAEKFGKESTK
jgi:malonate decarboxylase beta subunit